MLGIKPGFPARKALEQYRRLGGGGVQRAIDLLASPTSTCAAGATSTPTS